MLLRTGANPLPALCAAQGVLLLSCWHLRTESWWGVALAIIALLGLAAWFSANKRYRAIADHATSRIASAAQGYVEICGRGAQHASAPNLSKLTGLPCLWYRYQIEERTADNKWRVIERGVSSDTFRITDATGSCIVDPDDAEVFSTHKQTWHKDNYRYSEWLLLPHDQLYVLGELKSIGGPGVVLDLKKDVLGTLADWKKEPKLLRERFDANKDGEIDQAEWEHARREAVRHVRGQHRELRNEEAVTLVRAPGDGRLFLIANIPPEGLVRRFRWWGQFQIAVLAASLAAIIWILR